ncbi:MAG TPA: hypothetical protein VJN89_16700 [Candidatus Acidoferrum sp.]|nr:hypothetical protein [Candidatus Acidoferrum sp.]
MRGIVSSLSLAVLLVFRLAPSASDQKTEAGLIAAWEQEQKSDPTTIKFEKTKDRQYHFVTKRFPFDGELLVRNVVLEDYPGVNQDGIATGTVEVELQGVNDEFHRTFAASYGKWITGNTLYWDPEAQHWLTSEQYFQQVRERIPKQMVWPTLISFGWFGILLVIFGGLFFSLWRNNKRMKVLNQRSERSLQISERNGQLAERNAQIFERGLKLQEQNVKLFQEILEELKKISARP